MPDFVVHSVIGSPFGRAVLAALQAKGATYRLVPVEFAALGSAAHLARHPFGKVPVLEHGEIALYETSAILRYIDRVLPTPALTPPDPTAAARMDQVMAICDAYLFPGAGRIIAFNRFIGPRVFGRPPDEAALARALPKGRQALGALSQILGEQPFAAGDALSLADLCLASQLEFLSRAPDWAALTAETPNLVDYTSRLNAQPCLAATTWKRLAATARAA